MLNIEKCKSEFEELLGLEKENTVKDFSVTCRRIKNKAEKMPMINKKLESYCSRVKNCNQCALLLGMWMLSDQEDKHVWFGQPEIDWNKVPKGTSVWVREEPHGKKFYCSFLCEKDGEFYCYENRQRGYEDGIFVRPWKFCELDLREDVEKYTKLQ